MCTAATYKTKDFYFGRTLDYDFSYGCEVIITPRNYLFKFKHIKDIENHYAVIGMGNVTDDYPLYYDACNEKGLSMAGLNFVGNAFYRDFNSEKNNISSHEFIPLILGQCASVSEARKLIEKINIVDIPFSSTLPTAKLHWIIADGSVCITVESVEEGIKIYDNPVGVLTNNPTFDIQMFNLNNYMGLSVCDPQNSFSDKLPLKKYSRGMGALGLPGDLSSQSRFVRASFTKINSISKDSETDSVNQFFHILGSVEQQRGCCDVSGSGSYEITIYTSCCNANKGIYYYNTYNNHQICAVDMHKEDLNGCRLISYTSVNEEQIKMLN